MGEGDDSFAETVFNFFEILASTAIDTDPSYPFVITLLNGYMPLMIDLVRSDRGTFSPLSLSFRRFHSSTRRCSRRIRSFRRCIRRTLLRCFPNLLRFGGFVESGDQKNVLHGRSYQHLHCTTRFTLSILLECGDSPRCLLRRCD